MSVSCEYTIATYCHIFAYFSKVRTLHIFPHKLAFLTAILIFFVFRIGVAEVAAPLLYSSVTVWPPLMQTSTANTNRTCAFPRLGQLCNHSSPRKHTWLP